MSARRRMSEGKREEIFSQTAGACYYCGYAATDLDHIVPHSYVANDTEANLVPACSICNSIASNKHFASLQEKKDYILGERQTLHWQRKLARMVPVSVPAPFPTMPPAEVPVPPAPKVHRAIANQVEQPEELGPVNNPFKSRYAPVPKRQPKPAKVIENDSEYDSVDYDIEELMDIVISLSDNDWDAVCSARIGSKICRTHVGD